MFRFAFALVYLTVIFSLRKQITSALKSVCFRSSVRGSFDFRIQKSFLAFDNILYRSH